MINSSNVYINPTPLTTEYLQHTESGFLCSRHTQSVQKPSAYYSLFNGKPTLYLLLKVAHHLSLQYGKALFELKEWSIAKPHLEHDIHQWSHPESSLMLATILIQDGAKEEASDRLETMLARVEGSPMYHHRKHQPTIRKARKMLKTL